MRHLAPLVRCKRILDIGIGAGRTTPLLTLLSDQYVGIDYAQPMVEAAKQMYPDLDLRVGDARDLSEFAADSFDFVFFSFNGIDTMDEDGRRAVLKAVHRVLAEDGLLAFSTLNKDGRSFRESPIQLRRPGTPWDRSAFAAARLLWRNARDPNRVFRRIRNWRDIRGHYVDHGGWGTSALATGDFTLLNHFVTLSHLREELGESGFEVTAVYGGDQYHGPLPEDAETSNDDCLYAVARRLHR